MRITKRQREEVAFFEEYSRFKATPKEIDDFINFTALGKGNIGVYVNQKKNRIFESKRRLEITAKMWREDLCNPIDNTTKRIKGELVIIPGGILYPWELLEDKDFKSSYGQRYVRSIIKSLPWGKEWLLHYDGKCEICNKNK